MARLSSDDPPEFHEDAYTTLLRLLMDTPLRAGSIPGLPPAMRHNIYTMCLTASVSMYRAQLWEAYEMGEERVMVYLQVVSTDAREMACDNRHMAISPRGESA